MKLFSFFKSKKTIQQEDTARLQDKLNVYKTAFYNLVQSNPIASMFGGDKIANSLNYPSNIQFDTKTLRQRSRKAIFDSPQAAGIITRMKENVINSGLSLESTPMWDILSSTITDSERKLWTKRVEQLWKIYSNSKESTYDKKRNFYQLQSVIYHNYLRDGEVFLILRYSSDPNRLNPLSIQIIDADNIKDPDDINIISDINKRGNILCNGIEYSNTGEEIAYYVQDTTNYTIKRVEKIGKNSKRLLVIHAANLEYADQTRGIPMLTGVLQELQKIADYSLLELQAAIINAVIAVWVKPSAVADSSMPFAGVKAKTEFQSTDEEESVNSRPDKAVFTKGGLFVQNLKKGEEIQSYDTKRPNINFDAFVTSVIKNLSSSLSIPMEVLTMTFGQNYSASRATLLLFWNKIIMERSNFESDILDPIFEMWMIGEIEAGRIIAAGFDNKLLRQAWLNNRWIGISQPSIDPLKERNAVGKALEDGLTTREIESQKYNGTSFEDNVAKLKDENFKLAETIPQKI